MANDVDCSSWRVRNAGEIRALRGSVEAKAVQLEAAERAAVPGAARALRGVRAVGHRISMEGARVRVIGPSAPAVAAEVAKRAGVGAQRAMQEALR